MNQFALLFAATLLASTGVQQQALADVLDPADEIVDTCSWSCSALNGKSTPEPYAIRQGADKIYCNAQVECFNKRGKPISPGAGKKFVARCGAYNTTKNPTAKANYVCPSAQYCMNAPVPRSARGDAPNKAPEGSTSVPGFPGLNAEPAAAPGAGSPGF